MLLGEIVEGLLLGRAPIVMWRHGGEKQGPGRKVLPYGPQLHL